MAAQTFEQTPPLIRAVRFDGTNAAEVGDLVGHGKTPEAREDDDGTPYLSFVRLLDFGGEVEMRVHLGDWATMDDRGQMNVSPGTEHAPDGWRLTASATPPAPSVASPS